MYNPRRPDQALIGTVKGGVAVVSPQERKPSARWRTGSSTISADD